MDRTATQPSPPTTNIVTITATASATTPALICKKRFSGPVTNTRTTHFTAQHSSQNLHRHPASRPRAAPLYWLSGCLAALALHAAVAECPGLCECKWKSGKESVMCLNANLTHIPVPLDAGTQVLDLTGNEITSIPHDTFAAAELLNLQKVYLAKCRLRLIERFAFRKLINLVELDLSYNQLTSIPAQAFDAIPELRELKLTGNPIQRVPNEAFARTPQLVRLDLADCRLTVVEVRAFAGLEVSLEWLRLDGNKLSEVRAGTITSLSNLHGIELARNQWNCSCYLRPLRAWMLRENIPCGIPPICRSPERLAGRTWDKIDLDDFACVPQIIATDTTAHGVEGRNVTMSCYVEGVPEPSVRWLVKNRVIANLSSTGSDMPASQPRTAAATQGRKTYVVNMLRNASNLTILTADMQDAGIYTCAAENKAGKVEASVTLAVSRRPPEAPLGVKIVLLCVLIALLFVVGSSFAAICFCSLRRKRKMRLWNTVPPARTESYEKIEMTTRSERAGSGSGGGRAVVSGSKGNGTGGAAVANYCSEENGYLRSGTSPLCGSEDGIAIVNVSSTHAKRHGEYRNIPTHCDDEGVGCGNNAERCGDSTQFATKASSNTRWKNNTMRLSPEEGKRRGAASSTSTSTAASATATTKMTTGATLGDTDLHIPRLIDIGCNLEPATSSISSQVDAAARLAATNANVSTWTTQLPTTKITSIHSKAEYNSSDAGVNGDSTVGPYYGDIAGPGDEQKVKRDASNAHFVSEGHELFDGKYPDLLDIAKYAVAQATSKASVSMQGAATRRQLPSGGLCTLPRKLKTTGKYFKSSSDSQSPLLTDNSSKYSSSMLADVGFLNEATSFGRRSSAESTYASSHYGSGGGGGGGGGGTMHTAGQRSNSFLNLVQSCNQTAAGSQPTPNTSASAAAITSQQRRNPSLPSSPVHEVYQHQRSFSSAATPLLDFTLLTTRSGTAVTTTTMAATTGIAPTLHSTAVTSASSTAYDYHAAQLERFLEEYRNLQDQLCKMKETCETIRKKDTPLRGHAAQLADPVMFNTALAASSPTANPKTMLQNKPILPGQPPDPPPYWLHRNAMLKRLNETPTNIFKS